jgi:ribosomal protein L11 methyltransferase
MIDYIELNCFLTPYSEEIADIIVCELCELDFESFDTESEYVKAYIPENKFDNKKIEDSMIINHLKKEYDIKFSIQKIENKDWNAEWEANFQPIVIKDIVCVRGSFHPKNENCKYDVVINPKMSFGTGHHSTTALMLEHISETVKEGSKILDMGCGTSLLGIFASKCGAKEIVGIDIDEWAYNNSLENIELNSITNMKLMLGDAERLKELESFDIIFANINRNILINDMHYYVSHLENGGNLIMSGFYSQDLKLIKEEATRQGLRYIEHKEDNNWVAVKFVK